MGIRCAHPECKNPTVGANKTCSAHHPEALLEKAEQEALERDAAHWRALFASGRLRWLGSAGFDHHEDGSVEVRQPEEGWLHFGLEVWSKYPDFPAEEPNHLRAQKVLEVYADNLARKGVGQ